MSLSFNNKDAVKTYRNRKLFSIEKTLFDIYLYGDVLDLGCGPGATTRYIRDMGCNVLGVDISPCMIEAAREQHKDIRFNVGDAACLNIPEDVFDGVVFSFNGLDYLYPLENRINALNEIHRVLKHGGVFIFSSHEEAAIKDLSLIKRFKLRPLGDHYYREKTRTGTHVTYYGSPANNRRMLNTAGFRKVKICETFGHAWRYYVAWV